MARLFAVRIGALSLLAVAAVFVPGARAQESGADPAPSLSTLCGVSDDAQLKASSPESSQLEPPTYARWYLGDAGQIGISKLNAALAAHGESVMGLAVDNVTQTLYAVVDRDAPARVGSEANAAIEANGPYPFKVTAVASCHGGAELAHARDVLLARKFTNGDDLRYAAFRNVAAGTYDVAISADQSGADAAAVALRGELGSVVRVDASGAVSRTSGRLDDENPHFGAARIGNSASTPRCTAGFAATGYLGIRVMMTAGHCSNDYGGGTWYSGTHAFGVHCCRASNFPARDLGEFFVVSGQTFTNKIYTDPGTPTVRTVTGKQSPTYLSSICLSGAFSLARCGLTVSTANNSAMFCDATGCTYALDVAVGDTLPDPDCRGGDSGAPFYYRSGTSNAKVAGILVAGADAFGQRACYFHDVNVVEATMGVTVLTVP